jgi:hypothetical protein
MTDQAAVQAALDFIACVREDAALRERIREEAGEGGLGALVRLGAARGLHFTDEDLRAAFTRDWSMRWVRYGPDATTSA